jgi:cytochrome c oxidase subunit 4
MRKPIMATEPHPTEHITPVRTYLMVFAALLVLAAVTTWVSFQPLGHWHTPIAVGIAITKATLVVLYFMHASESDKLVHLVIIAALLWLAIMLGGVLADYLSRDVDRTLRNPAMQRVWPLATQRFAASGRKPPQDLAPLLAWGSFVT